MNTFFTFIQRINSLLMFCGLAALTLFVLWIIIESIDDHSRDVVATVDTPGTNEALSFYLDEFNDIPGTDTQMLRLDSNRKKPSLNAYGNYERHTRNILFLSGDGKATRWLFPDQSHTIHTVFQLKERGEDDRAARADKATLALYYLYSDKDTNGDGKITEDDETSLGLSKANGEGFVAALAGLDRVYSVSMVGDHAISVLYRIGTRLRHARYSVATLAREFDREIVAIPGAEYRE